MGAHYGAKVPVAISGAHAVRMRINLLAGLPSSRTLLKLFVAPTFLTGLMFLFGGLGYASMPAAMRVGEKLRAVGIAPGSMLARVVLSLIGAGKVSCVANHWFIHSDALDIFFALAAAPGFALVLAAHHHIRPPAPMAEDIPAVSTAVMLMLLGYSSSKRRDAAAAAKKKT